MKPDTTSMYGPGGLAPAMKEAAAAFWREGGAWVEAVAGPTPQWLPQAKPDADLIYSGSETMMTDFVVAMEPQPLHRQVTPLYMRPLAMLVRPGVSLVVVKGAVADVVAIAQDYGIYGDTAIAITTRGQDKSQAKAFVDFLQSAASAAIFARWCWTTQ